MLLIMLFMMIHNAFPHVHHQSDMNDAVVVEGEFHHHNHQGHHHHHSDKEDEDHEQKDLLHFLFKNHTHSGHTHQYIAATVKQVKPVKQSTCNLFFISAQWNADLQCTGTGLHRYVLFKNPLPQHPRLLSTPHRGPPSLG